MTHRMTIRSNPRLLMVPLIALGLLALAGGLLAVSPVVGVLALAMGAYIAYVLIRFLTKQLACTVEAREDGVELDLYGEEKVRLAWGDVTHLGVASDARKRRVLFFYREDEDRLLGVPDEFERFDALMDRAVERSRAVAPDRPFLRLELGPGQTVKDSLRTIVGKSRPEISPPP